MRFVSAVPVGSRVRGRFAPATVESVAGGIQVTWNITVEREGQDKPACVAEWIVGTTCSADLSVRVDGGLMTYRKRWMFFATALTAAVILAGANERAAESDLAVVKAESVGMSTQRLQRIHSYIQGYMDRE